MKSVFFTAAAKKPEKRPVITRTTGMSLYHFFRSKPAVTSLSTFGLLPQPKNRLDPLIHHLLELLTLKELSILSQTSRQMWELFGPYLFNERTVCTLAKKYAASGNPSSIKNKLHLNTLVITVLVFFIIKNVTTLLSQENQDAHLFLLLRAAIAFFLLLTALCIVGPQEYLDSRAIRIRKTAREKIISETVNFIQSPESTHSLYAEYLRIQIRLLKKYGLLEKQLLDIFPVCGRGKIKSVMAFWDHNYKAMQQDILDEAEIAVNNGSIPPASQHDIFAILVMLEKIEKKLKACIRGILPQEGDSHTSHVQIRALSSEKEVDVDYRTAIKNFMLNLSTLNCAEHSLYPLNHAQKCALRRNA